MSGCQPDVAGKVEFCSFGFAPAFPPLRGRSIRGPGVVIQATLPLVPVKAARHCGFPCATYGGIHTFATDWQFQKFACLGSAARVA
jgi:hypothetical protein